MESEVPGLYYIAKNELDTDLEGKIDRNKWTALTDSPNSRKVQHYGYKYNYNTYRIDEPTTPFPEFIQEMSHRLREICLDLGIIDESYVFNQCIINEYKVGQGISAHTDVSTYGSVIGCYTIDGCGNMVFTKGDSKTILRVAPGSLYIMAGDARKIWKHKMNPMRKRDGSRRISITFRNVSILEKK